MTERRLGETEVFDWEYPDYSYFEDEMEEEFDEMLPDNPRLIDMQRIARKTGNSAMLRNRPAMKRAIHEVSMYRAEKRVRKAITNELEKSGGSKGLMQLFEKVVEKEGNVATNSTIGLIYVMEQEGKLEIAFEQSDYDFVMLGERYQIQDEQVMVHLIHKTQAK